MAPQRDAKGRFVEKRAHEYRLRYDDGTHEVVYALTPSAAVRARTKRMLPFTLTDLTALNEWVERLHSDGSRFTAAPEAHDQYETWLAGMKDPFKR